MKNLIVKGYIFGGASVIGYATSATACQVLGRRIPDFQLSAVRFAMQFLICLPVIYRTGTSFDVSFHSLGNIIKASVSSIIFNIFFYFGTAILPLTHAYALKAGTESVLFGIITKFIQKKAFGIFHYAAVFLCVFGCFLIVQPWAMFSKGFIPLFMRISNDSMQGQLANISSSEQYGEFGIDAGNIVLLGYMLIIISAVSNCALGLVLENEQTNPLLIATLMGLFSTAACVCISFYTEEIILERNPIVIVFIFLHAFGAAIGSVTVIFSLIYIGAPRVSLVQSSNIVILLIVQYTAMGNGLHGRMNFLEASGCIIIVISLALSVWASVRIEKTKDVL